MSSKSGMKTVVLLGSALLAAGVFFAFVKPGSAKQPSSVASGKVTPPPSGFGDYWYQGQAEITSYNLEQARYGEMRNGTAVLMYVAEDFSPERLTKAMPDEKNKVPVLKLNFEKRFVTGIYPYHMLMTVATPVDLNTHPWSLKMSVSSAEWCGASYSQLNLQGKKYALMQHSYFPDEGDDSRNLPAVFLEDEIWTRIRVSPNDLPTGKFQMIHGGFFSRLLHQPLQSGEVNATLADDSNPSLRVYTLQFPAQERTLTIRFEKDFPYGIEGWEETYADGFGDNKRQLTTRATKIKRIKSDYWSRNHNSDAGLRTELGLDGK